ncbi:MAG: MurR/RpiR family transcriptional regulator [Bacilli bacterium]
MESIIYLLREKSKEHNNEGILAKALLDYSGDYKTLKIREIVEVAHVSNSTATRLAKSLGLQGYNELCYELAEEVSDIYNNSKVFYNEMTDMYLMEYNAAILNTAKILDFELIKKLAKDIIKAEYILFIGIGTTQLRAFDFASKIRKIGIRTICQMDYHQLEVEAKVASENALILSISYSGLTKEVNKMAKYGYQAKANCYSITSNDKVLGMYSKVILLNGIEPQQRVFSITSVSAINFVLDLVFLEILKSDPDKYEPMLLATKHQY